MNHRVQLWFLKGYLLWYIYLSCSRTRSIVAAFCPIVLRNRGSASTPNRYLVEVVQQGFKEQIRGQRRLISIAATAQETGGADVTTSTTTSIPSSTLPSSSEHLCRFCGKSFVSRNALFRHLRNDEPCSSAAAAASGGGLVDASKTIYKRDTVVILYSYDSFSFREVNYTEFTSGATDIGLIEKLICDAFDHALQKEFGSSVPDQNEGDSTTTTTGTMEMGVMSCTQASVAKLRTNSLSQENGVSASGDVMTLSYKYPIKRTLLDEKRGYQEHHRMELFRSLRQSVNDYLSNRNSNYDVENMMGSASTNISNIQMLSMKLLPPGTKFHAESSCTQRIYHYLLPMQWLTMGGQIEKWWTDTQNNEKAHNQMQGKGNSHSESDSDRDSKNENKGRRDRNPRPEQLRTLKKVLRSFESREKGSDYDGNGTDNRNDNDNSGSSADSTYTKNFETSKWRFGLLAKKLPKPWHNFCDRTMRGVHASPNNKPVWRTLDRCRIVDFVSFFDDDHDDYDYVGDDNDNIKPHVFAVVEFRGDDFIQQQVRKIMGTAVAVTNGWLPPSIANIATCQEVFIETPLAPPNHMYQTRPKFHYDELSNGGNSIFHDEVDERVEVQLSRTLQRRIFNQWRSNHIKADEMWINHLKEEVAPRIREQLGATLQKQENVSDDDLYKIHPTPLKYKETLTLLQDISSSGRWPTTSKARSKVIKDYGDDNNTTSEGSKSKTSLSNNNNNNGSFTIINPKYMDGILMKEESSGIKKPLGNELFPELVDAVFSLEERLSSEIMMKSSSTPKRPPSSHCAINCNATFKPHIDSGRGYGQSLSMIVGLGTYSGGSLFVEGEAFDILYQPLEFDGWRDRHWTEQFRGERFSLVWFTPHLKGVNDSINQ